jgi:hypothetical protein
MIREQARTAARRYEAANRKHAGASSNAGDILQRIASVVGEIDALKRERHIESVFGARAKLAAAYFRKRRGAPAASCEGPSSPRSPG